MALHGGPVFGGDELFQGLQHQFGLGVAEHFAQAIVDFHPLLFGRQDRHADQSLLEVAAEPLFAFQQPLFRLLAVHDFVLQFAVDLGQFRRPFGDAFFKQVVRFAEPLLRLVAMRHLLPQVARHQGNAAQAENPYPAITENAADGLFPLRYPYRFHRDGNRKAPANVAHLVALFGMAAQARLFDQQWAYQPQIRASLEWSLRRSLRKRRGQTPLAPASPTDWARSPAGPASER